MSERSFAGIRYRDRLYTGYYGRLFRAETASGNPVRLLEVDETLARADGFAEVLTSSGSDLALLDHPNVVGTRTIGRAPDGNLVVITDNVEGCALDELLGIIESAGRRGLPVNVATIVAEQVIQGLAGAHERGIVHGALHPRSVSIAPGGLVRIDHFAVGRALAEASVKDGTPSLLRGFSGFLAPELALGDSPDEATDVYAAGAVMFAMLTGWAPPGELHVSPALKAVIMRALDTNRGHRYAGAGELLQALGQALAEDGWTAASRQDLDDYIKRSRTRPETDPGRPSDSLLMPPARPATDPGRASQSMSMPPIQSPDRAQSQPPSGFDSVPPGPTSKVDLVLADLSTDLAGDLSTDLAGEPMMATPIPANSIRESSAAAMAALAALESMDEDEQPEAPSGAPANAPSSPPSSPPAGPPSSPPASSRPGTEGDTARPTGPESRPPTTLPMLTAELPAQPATPPATPAAGVMPAAAPLATPAPTPTLAPTPAPAQAPVLAQAPVQASPAQARAQEPPLAYDTDLPTLSKRRIGPAFWAVVAVAALGVLVWVIRGQAELREQAAERAEETKAAQEEALQRFREAQPKSGQILVSSTPDEAAVWLLLGRAPLHTAPMSASMLHELRLELDGYRPLDLRVEGQHWSGSEDALRASVTGTLQPGTPERPPPAAPAEPPPEASEGLPAKGQGSIHVTSDPEGAQVWLLVGFTPDVNVSVQAGQDYELEVVKDGYLPGVVVVRPEDWDDSENAIERSVELKRRPRNR